MWKNTEYDIFWLMLTIGVIALVVGYFINNIFLKAMLVSYGWTTVILVPLVVLFFWRRKKYNS